MGRYIENQKLEDLFYILYNQLPTHQFAKAEQLLGVKFDFSKKKLVDI